MKLNLKGVARTSDGTIVSPGAYRPVQIVQEPQAVEGVIKVNTENDNSTGVREEPLKDDGHKLERKASGTYHAGFERSDSENKEPARYEKFDDLIKAIEENDWDEVERHLAEAKFDQNQATFAFSRYCHAIEKADIDADSAIRHTANLKRLGEDPSQCTDHGSLKGTHGLIGAIANDKPILAKIFFDAGVRLSNNSSVRMSIYAVGSNLKFDDPGTVQALKDYGLQDSFFGEYLHSFAGGNLRIFEAFLPHVQLKDVDWIWLLKAVLKLWDPQGDYWTPRSVQLGEQRLAWALSHEDKFPADTFDKIAEHYETYNHAEEVKHRFGRILAERGICIYAEKTGPNSATSRRVTEVPSHAQHTQFACAPIMFLGPYRSAVVAPKHEEPRSRELRTRSIIW